MASHNLEKIIIDGLEILGYSVAGEETVIAVPQLDVCFDIGKAPDQLIPINNVLLTHGHIDHSAGIAYYLSHRKFCGQKPGTVLAPENCILPMRDIIDAFGRLDGNKIPAKFIPVSAGEEFKIKPNLIARTFATRHCRGSVGYCIIEKKKKLKPEYSDLTSKELVALKRKFVEIEYPVETPLISYLGDTKDAGYHKLDFVANSKILIAECTFVVDEHIVRADAGKHMYIDEFVKMAEKLNNEHIIMTHLSQRTSIGQAKKVLRRKMPGDLYKKTIILMDRHKPEIIE